MATTNHSTHGNEVDRGRNTHFSCMACHSKTSLHVDSCYKCNRCHLAWYCSQACAQHDWVQGAVYNTGHHLWCRTLQLSSHNHGLEGIDNATTTTTTIGVQPRTPAAKRKKATPPPQLVPECEALDASRRRATDDAARRKRRRETLDEGARNREERALAALLAVIYEPTATMADGDENTLDFARTMLRVTPPTVVLDMLDRVGTMGGGEGANSVSITAPEGAALEARLARWSNHGILSQSLLIGDTLRERVRTMPPAAIVVLNDLSIRAFLAFYAQLMTIEDRASNDYNTFRRVLRKVWQTLTGSWSDLPYYGIPSTLDMDRFAQSIESQAGLQLVYTAMRGLVQDDISLVNLQCPLHIYRPVDGSVVEDNPNNVIALIRASILVDEDEKNDNEVIRAVFDELYRIVYSKHQMIMLYVHFYHMDTPFLDTFKTRLQTGIIQAFGSVLCRFMKPAIMLEWLDGHVVDLYSPKRNADIRMWSVMAPPCYRRAKVKVKQYSLAIGYFNLVNIGFVPTLLGSVYIPLDPSYDLARLNIDAVDAPSSVNASLLNQLRAAQAEIEKLAAYDARRKTPVTATDTLSSREQQCLALSRDRQSRLDRQGVDRQRRTAWLRAFVRVLDDNRNGDDGVNARVSAFEWWSKFKRTYESISGHLDNVLPNVLYVAPCDTNTNKDDDDNNDLSPFPPTPGLPGTPSVDYMDYMVYDGDDNDQDMPLNQLQSLNLDELATPATPRLYTTEDEPDVDGVASNTESFSRPAAIPQPAVPTQRINPQVGSTALWSALFASNSESNSPKALQDRYDGLSPQQANEFTVSKRIGNLNNPTVLQYVDFYMETMSRGNPIVVWYDVETRRLFNELFTPPTLMPPPSPKHIRLWPQTKMNT